MQKSTIITLGVIAGILLVVGFFAFQATKETRNTAESESAAASALRTNEGQSPYTDIDGNPVELEDYLGQVLVVNSWASWCPFCVQELPDFAELAAEYSEQDVTVLAINRAEPASTAQLFLEAVGATEGVQLILDPDDRYYDSIGGFTMPETVFYDTAGNIVVHKRGFMAIEEMRRHVEAAQESVQE